MKLNPGGCVGESGDKPGDVDRGHVTAPWVSVQDERGHEAELESWLWSRWDRPEARRTCVTTAQGGDEEGLIRAEVVEPKKREWFRIYRTW